MKKSKSKKTAKISRLLNIPGDPIFYSNGEFEGALSIKRLSGINKFSLKLTAHVFYENKETSLIIINPVVAHFILDPHRDNSGLKAIAVFNDLLKQFTAQGFGFVSNYFRKKERKNSLICEIETVLNSFRNKID